MHYPRSRGHPLDITRINDTVIALVVMVFNGAFKRKGYGFETAMRMWTDAFGILGGFNPVGSPIVQLDKG